MLLNLQKKKITINYKVEAHRLDGLFLDKIKMKSISKELISEVIKKRKSATHKGNYGRVLLIGGSNKFGGGLIMAAEGALNSGAGLTTVATD